MREIPDLTQPAEERFEETKEKPAIFDEVTTYLEARREAGATDDSLMQYILSRIPELDQAELSELEETKLKAVLFSLRGLSDETAEMLVRIKSEDFVFEHYDQFALKDPNAFIAFCLDNDVVNIVIDHIDLFPDLDHTTFVNDILRRGRAIYTLAGKLENFRNLDESIVMDLLERDHSENPYYLSMILKNVNVFPTLNVQTFIDGLVENTAREKLATIIDSLPAIPEINTDKVFEKAKLLVDKDFLANHYLIFSLIKSIDYFDRTDERDEWLITNAMKTGKSNLIAQEIGRFPAKRHPEVAIRLIELGGGEWVFANLDKFAESAVNKIIEFVTDLSKPQQHNVLGILVNQYLDRLSLDHQDKIAFFLLRNRDYRSVFNNLDKFAIEKRDAYVGKAINQSGLISVVLEHLNSFEGLSRETCNEMLPVAINRFFNKAVLMNSIFSPPLEESLTTFVGVLDDQATVDVYEWFIENGKDVEKLKRKQELVTKALFHSDQQALNKLERDQRFFDLAKAPLRYESSVHGNHSHEQFRKSITRYFYERAVYEPLPTEYVPGTLTLFKKGKDNPEYTYSPEFQARWKTLLYSFQHAQLISDQPPGSKSVLPPLYARFTTILQDQQTELEAQLERAPNEHAKRSVEEQIQTIDSIDLNTVEGMSDAFKKLYHRKKQPELAELFRTLGLYVAFRDQRTRGQIQPNFILMSPVTPSDRDISQVLDFVHHVTHQETWQQLEAFQESAVADALASLFHTGALEQELKRMQAGVSKGTEIQIEVIPSRDLLTEFSGHIGDACWASRFNILKDYPHISSLTFMQNDKVAGSCLLIDTITEDGEEVTIIRGLNPLESVINKLDCASFVTALAAYLGPIAEQRGRKLAIVIDNHSGGSGTNRPMLFAYLSGLKQSLTRVSGIDLIHTRFNGYDITRDTYYLPTKE